MSKRSKILQHFKSGKPLTKLQCITKYGALNLGDIVHILRNKGYPIVTTMREVGDSRYASYRLVRGK